MTLKDRIQIRRVRKEDIESVALLIGRTFGRFNRFEGTPEGVKGYIGMYNYRCNRSNLEERFLRAPVCLVAVVRTKVVGVLRGRDEWIVNLFVDGDYHRRGIASRLVAECERSYRQRGVDMIRVNSSLYAVPFYQALGYKKTTGVRTKHGAWYGVKYQPMKKGLS